MIVNLHIHTRRSDLTGYGWYKILYVNICVMLWIDFNILVIEFVGLNVKEFSEIMPHISKYKEILEEILNHGSHTYTGKNNW